MSATAARTRKPRNTAATEYTKYSTLRDGSIWEEVVLPTPVENHPLTASQAASPLILVLVAFVAVSMLVSMLVKLLIGLGCLLVKIAQKVAPKVRDFVSAQLGGEIIDFRVYSAIFD